MSYALVRLGRNPYQTTAQKLVQARVYAQGLTVLVLLATAALEIGDRSQGKGRWVSTLIIDPEDPEHKRKIEKKVYREDYAGESQWRGKCNRARMLASLTVEDMVDAEERRLKERQHDLHRPEQQGRSAAARHHAKDSAGSSDKKEQHGTAKKGDRIVGKKVGEEPTASNSQ